MGTKNASRPRLWPRLVATSGAVTAAAAAGGIATSSGLDTPWYDSLEKPSWQPPPQVFPIVWTSLYAIIAAGTATALAAQAREAAEAHFVATDDDPDPTGALARSRSLKRALAVNLVLNAGWCWSFFVRRNLALAQWNALALAASSADLARRVGRERPGWGRAVGLYAAWCSFATVLTTAIKDRNPDT